MGKRETKKSSGNKENSPKTNVSNSGKTNHLNSTEETDIIECSIVGYENKYNCLKNTVPDFPKLRVSDKNLQDSPCEAKNMNLRNESGSAKGFCDFLRKSIRKSYGFTDEAPLPEKDLKTGSPIQTPCLNKTSGSHLIMNKIISTLKKTPEAPYLSKSKLRNIELWLRENDVENVRTPPFANLSVTPKNSTRPKRKCLTSRKEDKENVCENDSIDSEVEGVLKAVYGDDWMQKNVASQSKTEPRRKPIRRLMPATEGKKQKLSSPFHLPVRRNILSAKKSVDANEEVIDLDDSAVSGIKEINLENSSCSEGFIKTKKVANVPKRRKFDEETSSVESMNFPGPAKKKNVKVGDLGNNLSGKNSTTKSGVSLKTPRKTFLASLSVSTPNSRCHPDAQYYKINFKSKKEELVKKLYKLYNGEIFEGKLADDMSFSWNVKLRGTAGFCYNKRITKSTGEVIRLARVEFSTKIVDRADRLRDTMIHELCHAASWVVDGVLDGHGPVWTSWAARARKRFPELPAIKRCHNYDIVSKYVYRCTGCGYSIKRHSKSIDTERKRCGHCYGVLELLLNKKKKGKGEVPEFDTTRTLRTPNKFAVFVKENYHSVKSAKGNAKHAEIMKTLSEQYAAVKNGTKSGKKL